MTLKLFGKVAVKFPTQRSVNTKMPELKETKSMRTQETPDQHLLRSLRVTASARFNASRRLRLHEKLSLWSISFFSLVLITIPLFEPFGITTTLSNGAVNLASITSATLILIASIIVNGSSFSERAEKMHRCGLELNALAREVDLTIQNAKVSEDKIRDLHTQYDGILSRYENHSNIDFKLAQIDKAPDFYGIKWYHQILIKLESALVFSPYLLAMAAGAFFLLSLL